MVARRTVPCSTQTPRRAERTEEQDADAQILELIPEGFGTQNPTTRQLILFAMRADLQGEWPIARIFDVLVMHGWLRSEEEEHVKRITDMTALWHVTSYSFGLAVASTSFLKISPPRSRGTCIR